ncbi:hypothetical protein NKG05_02435 [Oerskovia sp. M15]
MSWGRAARAIGLGSLALASSVGLAAVAAWLIARASQMPPVLQLSVATVAVRAFGISRGCSGTSSGWPRTTSRCGHGLAPRQRVHLAGLRPYGGCRGPAPRRPARPCGRRRRLRGRRGRPRDHPCRGRSRGLGRVGDPGRAFLPSVGAALLACLLLAGLLGPWLSARAARRTEERGASARPR